jgi:hypothetical protein
MRNCTCQIVAFPPRSEESRKPVFEVGRTRRKQVKFEQGDLRVPFARGRRHPRPQIELAVEVGSDLVERLLQLIRRRSREEVIARAGEGTRE